MVIRKLLNRERQKSVTLMASEKFARLQLFGRERIPEMLLVMSLGCLNAITMAIYRGNTMVISPISKRIVMGQLTFSFAFTLSFIIAAPPFSR